MIDEELLHPGRQVFDARTMHRENEYLCHACLREEYGACSISPYHKVLVAKRLTPFDTGK
jgi:hypothetical protein